MKEELSRKDLSAPLYRVQGDGARFLAYYASIQRQRLEKRDCMSGFLRRLLQGKTALNRRARLCPVLILRGDEVLMGTVLAVVEGLDRHLQLSFFEASEEHHEAFHILLGVAKEVGESWGCDRIIGGLNLHVNYGLGFLEDEEPERVSFGMNHNPPFYNALFLKAGFCKEELLTYRKEMSTFQLPFSKPLIEKLEKRYTVRTGRFWPLKPTIKTYTALNNACFTTHRYYYPRVFQEDLELFREFSWLLRRENLLLVYRDKRPVGFLLWYPDFSERIPKGKRPSLWTVIQVRILKRSIRTFKIVEMGVLPEERQKGAILALFLALHQRIGTRFKACESSWILDANAPSKGFGLKWADGEGKHYAVYEKPMDS